MGVLVLTSRAWSDPGLSMGSSESTPAPPQHIPERRCTLVTDSEIKELRMLHAHIHVASPDLQKRAACLLANLAENDINQETIVNEGGLSLLVPLMQSSDREVQRLAVHSLANLSVNVKNRPKIVQAETLDVLIGMLSSPLPEVQRQSAKTIANLAVDAPAKPIIVEHGALCPLLEMA